MKHPKLMWLAFGVAIVAVFAAMGFITATALRLDAAEAESRQRAQLEENVRLALWRMDSALAPFIAAEHARPYAAFHTPRPSKTREEGVYLSDWFATATLPGDDAPFVRLYFQFEPDGTLTSPQAAANRKNQVGIAGRADVQALRKLAPLERLAAALPEPSSPIFSEPPPVAVAQQMQAPNAPAVQQQAQQAAKPVRKGEQFAQGEQDLQQQQRNFEEFQARAQNSARQVAVQNELVGNTFSPGGDGSAGVMHPVWVGDALLLARRVAMPEGEFIQGCWIDWPGVREWLLKGSVDLLPGARLEPVAGAPADAGGRLLASLPLQLIPGELPPAAAEQSSPLRLSLLIAWACVLLASAAVGALLRGVVSLSERRASFVSAVTHELRTPLTTLRMYTEMLESGMVRDEARRRHYLSTLRVEADRLGHLVDNVLAYSRLERNRANGEVISANLTEVLARPIERLTDRARQADMTLDAQITPEAAAATIRVNPTSLEQILFNLVDNACKYAAGATNRTIHLQVERAADEVLIHVHDHGPGMPPAQVGRLFKPFSKSVQEAANSAPGLGLGLTLSQRLARSMGGDLRLDPAPGGARFTVTVPVVR